MGINEHYVGLCVRICRGYVGMYKIMHIGFCRGTYKPRT